MEQVKLLFRKKNNQTAIAHHNTAFAFAICLSPWRCSTFPIWGLILPHYMSTVAAQGSTPSKASRALLHTGSSAGGI